jgi:hypothetical protein
MIIFYIKIILTSMITVIRIALYLGTLLYINDLKNDKNKYYFIKTKQIYIICLQKIRVFTTLY